MKPVRKINQQNKQKDISNGLKVAVLASGKGSNFQAIAKAVLKKKLKVDLKLVLTNKKNALVRNKAKKFKIKEIFIDPKNFKSRLGFDKEIVKILRQEKIKLVILAGYMKILTPYFVKSFKNRILNIHPAILPIFKGTDAIAQAFKYGCRVTGVTVHLVDEKVDHGPIILQETIKITKGMTLAGLEKKIHQLEHKLYPLAIKLIVDKKVKLSGRNVKII